MIPSMERAGLFVAQVYVIHHDGFVLLSREYDQNCMSGDPQLIGGFLAAINSFTKSSSVNTTCSWDELGRHQLVDIGMSCSRWFIRSSGEYTIALLLNNDSVLIQNQMWGTIGRLASRIFNAFDTFRVFTDGAIASFLDYSDEFGETVDNILFEVTAGEMSEAEYLEGKTVLEKANLKEY